MQKTHVNNSREQKWSVSKTVCLQNIERPRKGFTVLRVARHGTISSPIKEKGLDTTGPR